MREIKASDITAVVAELCMRANYELGDDVHDALEDALAREESPLGKDVLSQLLENAEIARSEQVPMCQDTGVAVVFAELGQDVHITGGSLSEAINTGVAKGYSEGYLRKSVVGHPLERKNTGDNTPAVIYTETVPGDRLKITVAAKGAGGENMSGISMLKPSDGAEGVKRFVVETVKAAGANPCPPIIVGVGIGGAMEKAALLAKKALLRRIGEHNANPADAELERELLRLVNDTGIGPAGLGGRMTALAVNVETYPCHIGSLPVAVNIQCHAARYKEVML
ncbi:MAG TPA: fumarate hydratase [Armatimonadota bacterium]|nr:fumarate hydratase [Armatimonadota bacterium]